MEARSLEEVNVDDRRVLGSICSILASLSTRRSPEIPLIEVDSGQSPSTVTFRTI